MLLRRPSSFSLYFLSPFPIALKAAGAAGAAGELLPFLPLPPRFDSHRQSTPGGLNWSQKDKPTRFILAFYFLFSFNFISCWLALGCCCPSQTATCQRLELKLTRPNWKFARWSPINQRARRCAPDYARFIHRRWCPFPDSSASNHWLNDSTHFNDWSESKFKLHSNWIRLSPMQFVSNRPELNWISSGINWFQ